MLKWFSCLLLLDILGASADPPITYLQYKSQLVYLLIRALTIENDTNNTQMLLGKEHQWLCRSSSGNVCGSFDTPAFNILCSRRNSKIDLLLSDCSGWHDLFVPVCRWIDTVRARHGDVWRGGAADSSGSGGRNAAVTNLHRRPERWEIPTTVSCFEHQSSVVEWFGHRIIDAQSAQTERHKVDGNTAHIDWHKHEEDLLFPLNLFPYWPGELNTKWHIKLFPTFVV